MNFTISYPRLGTIVCALIYLVVPALHFLVDLAARPIWVDEALSYYQVNGKNFREMLDSIGAGANAFPYSYFLLLWAVDRMFGLGPVLLRLLSLFFAFFALLVVHKILSARFGTVTAFVACASALLLSNEFLFYSHEGRPYSMYIFFASLCVHLAMSLLDKQQSATAVICTGAIIAFSLPAVHYVGAFYSASILLAILLAREPRNRHFSLQVLGGFVLGWLLFLAIHFHHIGLFIGKAAVIDPRWIPRPDFRIAYDVVLMSIRIPPAVCGIVIGAIGYYLLVPEASSRAPVRARSNDRFLYYVAITWLATPPAFALIAALGMPNLNLARYFAPSQLAIALMAALLLRTLVLPIQGTGRQHASLLGLGATSWMLIVTAGFLTPPTLAATIKALSHNGIWRQAAPDFDFIAHSPVPCVTNNLHLYFQYQFYYAGSQKLYLLRKTQDEVTAFSRFNRNLLPIAVDQLAGIRSFRFVQRQASVIINHFPEFDIHEWAKSNGYRVTAEEKHTEDQIYLVEKI